MTVFSVAYRLAPEWPAPAAVIDGCRAVSAVLGSGNIEGVVLCGDSAGAAIALAVERRADAAIRDRIRGVCAFYGCYGLRETPSIRAFGSRADGLDAACIERLWTLANDPLLPSPYSIDALGGVPGAPVYLLAAGRDPFRDDTFALAAAYRTCGRPHDLDLVEEAAHGFLHETGRSAAATEAIARVGAWILSKS
jgi:acetyl esterase